MGFEVKQLDVVSGQRELLCQADDETNARLIAIAMSKEWPKDAIEVWAFDGHEMRRTRVYMNGRTCLIG